MMIHFNIPIKGEYKHQNIREEVLHLYQGMERILISYKVQHAKLLKRIKIHDNYLSLNLQNMSG